MQSHYRNNAYRVLGLPGNASRNAVLDAASSLRLRARLSMPAPHADPLVRFFPLQLTEALLDDALRRLQHPAQRIQERLFWFTSADSMDVDCWAKLTAGELPAAQAGWSESTTISRRANAARTTHLRALTADLTCADPKPFLSALGAWKRLFDRPEFWELQRKLEDTAGFLPLASDDEFEKLRSEAPRLLLLGHAAVIRTALIFGKVDLYLASCHLKILRGSEFQPELRTSLEEAAIERYTDGLAAHWGNPTLELTEERFEIYLEVVKPIWQKLFLANRMGTASALRLGEALSGYLLRLSAFFLQEDRLDAADTCIDDAIDIMDGTASENRQQREVVRVWSVIQARRAKPAAPQPQPQPKARLKKYRLYVVLTWRLICDLWRVFDPPMGLVIAIVVLSIVQILK
jgi:hypothetical protein